VTKKKCLIILFAASVLALNFSFSAYESPVEKVFHEHAKAVINDLEKFDYALGENVDTLTLRQRFVSSRLAYKRASVLSDYFFPILLKNINGPDLRYAVEDNPDIIHEPHGFQVVERLVYGETTDENRRLLREEIRSLITTFTSINEQPELQYKLRDDLLYDAMKSAVIRMVAQGLTGFDSPVALNSIKEARSVLAGIDDISNLIAKNDAKLSSLLDDATKYLSDQSDFNSFDRLTFIKKFADPIYKQLTLSAISNGKLLPVERRPLNQYAVSIFSDTLFDINFFSPNERYRMNPLRVQLGKSLFYDSIFSTTVNRSCASCHNPSKAFTDGLKVPVAINQSTMLKRNTPTLLHAAYQTRFFYDSRASTLENQLNSVVHNIDEMNGSLKQSAERIEEHTVYREQFAKAYPNDRHPITDYNIANAISSYVRSLSSFDTKFDRYMRDEAQLTSQEKKGFNLFAGKAKCATCHYIPLFNGLVPPQFTEPESEVLGTPSSATSHMVDSDLGKFNFTRSEIHKHAFKTPSLRNISRTAPYMHNGIFSTLEQVIEFYNKGGGAGAGIELNNQTLPTEPLHLSKKEVKTLIAFLNTLD
jgi:cytochrome c peroxidase